MGKISRQDQKLLASWAADTAERVLPFFEKAFPKDKRPRKAIEACRRWVHIGVFKMADIRKASLDSHTAAREAKGNSAACFAARAAGHAVATAHVPQHAYGPSFYAFKAVAAADPANADVKIVKEYDWQFRHLPKKLRKGWQDWQKKRLPKQLKSALWKQLRERGN
ncbi:MAG: putative immunity protein [Candidatus Micrarchaeota archaeon]